MTDPALTVERVMTDDLRDWLLRDLRFPVLAVIGERGVPVQSVMWFDVDPNHDDTILMNTKIGRAKERQLRANRQVSVCFEEGLTWVALQGTVELDEDRAASMRDIKALARRYGSDGTVFDGQERVTLRIRVSKVIRHD